MNVAVATHSSAASIARRIRVMIVDDAVVVRGLFARWVEAEPDLEMVASLRSAREALAQIERADPDVVLLDIEMPELDGLAALPLLLAKKRNLVVIMASTLTRRNAEISLKALALGATDYIPKPTSSREAAGSNNFRRELIEKVRQLGLRAKRLRVPSGVRTRGGEAGRGVLAPARKREMEGAAPGFVLRAMPAVPPRVLLIGASTGGPQALNALMAQLGGVIERAPVLITQHMPPTFTAILAEHLGRISKRPAHEAVDGEEVNAGTIYLAPGGKHMRVARRDGIAVIVIDDGEPVNFCKPSVDPLFSSAAQVWGSWALGLMLTGMGADGSRGSQALVAAGGSIVAQDEASSVIWGMPGQVAHLGLCSAVLPLKDIAGKLTRLFGGDGP
jgi:two-component system, chemotaxis family, protein-glutamate methylesterase/glutaminase